MESPKADVLLERLREYVKEQGKLQNLTLRCNLLPARSKYTSSFGPVRLLHCIIVPQLF
jgi:hypothetical protein